MELKSCNEDGIETIKKSEQSTSVGIEWSIQFLRK